MGVSSDNRKEVVVQSGDLMIPEPEGYPTLGIAADNQHETPIFIYRQHKGVGGAL